MYEDEKLVCEDCGQEFVFSAGEQEFYAEKGLVNKPKRCPECRKARRKQHRDPPSKTAKTPIPGGEAGGITTARRSESREHRKQNPETGAENPERKPRRQNRTAGSESTGRGRTAPFLFTLSPRQYGSTDMGPSGADKYDIRLFKESNGLSYQPERNSGYSPCNTVPHRNLPGQ